MSGARAGPWAAAAAGPSTAVVAIELAEPSTDEPFAFAKFFPAKFATSAQTATNATAHGMMLALELERTAAAGVMDGAPCPNGGSTPVTKAGAGAESRAAGGAEPSRREAARSRSISRRCHVHGKVPERRAAIHF